MKKAATKNTKVKTSGKVGRPTKKETRYKNVGRKTVMTLAVIGKLETAFATGYTDEQACIFAGISPDALYDYCRKNPEFGKRKELLKKNVDMQAKRNLFERIVEGDKATSMWWLERKCKDEFSTRVDQNHKGNLSLTLPVVIDDIGAGGNVKREK